MDQGGGGGSGEKWSDSGYILKVEPKRFPPKLEMGYEIKTGIKNHSKDCGLNNGRNRHQLT